MSEKVAWDEHVAWLRALADSGQLSESENATLRVIATRVEIAPMVGATAKAVEVLPVLITEFQCCSCGRVAPYPDGSGYTDGANPRRGPHGCKAIQRQFWEDRDRAYWEWRYRLGQGFTSNIDLIEWVSWRRRLTPVMALEVTLVPGEYEVSTAYLGRISGRIRDQTQRAMALAAARRLGVPVYIVAVRANLKEFWVFKGLETNASGKWVAYTEAEYVEWLRVQRQECLARASGGLSVSA